MNNSILRPLTILSSACGAMFMHGFFRCLKENGERDIRIIGVDMAKEPVSDPIIDSYYNVPSISAPNYVNTLLDICRKESVDIFFPQISMELELVRKRIEDFKSLGVKVAVTDNDYLKIANNKVDVYEMMKSAGINTPEFFKISSIEDFRHFAGELGFPDKPICVKVAESSGSRGVRIVMPKLSKADLFLHAKPSSLQVSMEEMESILTSLDE